MARIFPHVVFGIFYLAIGLAVVVLLAITGADTSLLQHLAGPVAAPCALLIARRRGTLSLFGVFVTSLLLGLWTYAATVGIYHSVASPTGGSVPFFAFAKLGGWPFVLGNALWLLSPVAWLHIINLNRGPRLPSGSAA